MSWLPNTRLKKDRSRFSSEVTDNPYYEGNLTDENKARIQEFDFAVEQVENAFDNLECMETEELDIDQEYHLNKVISDEATLKALSDQCRTVRIPTNQIVYINKVLVHKSHFYF